MSKWIVIVIILCGGFVFGGSHIEVNGGFDKPTNGIPEKWIMNKALPGKIQVLKDGDQNVLELASEAKRVHVFSKVAIKVAAGDKVTVSAKIKGSGQAIVGLYLYTDTGKWLGKNELSQCNASIDWKKETFTFELADFNSKKIGLVRVVFGVSRKSTVSFADLKVEKANATSKATPSTAIPSGKKKIGLTLPKSFYGVPDIETAIYLENIILAKNTNDYVLQIEPAIGTLELGRWSIVPTPQQQGKKVLTISIVDKKLKNTLAKGNITLNVAPKTAGEGEKLTLLIVGDSLTGASQYPRELGRLLSLKGNPTWEMLGSNKVGKGVCHEGYGGWTWLRFLSEYVADSKNINYTRKCSSPFVFLDQAGKPQVDIQRYFNEKCNGKIPNVITIMLGINDCFYLSKQVNDYSAVNLGIDKVLSNADRLIKLFRQAAPKATIGICLTTPPNIRQEAFTANYKGHYNRWPWKQIQHTLVQRQISHFGKREKDNIYIIPTELNIDCVNGYPELNGVHPNKKGYKQIAATIYSWLKWQFYQKNI